MFKKLIYISLLFAVFSCDSMPKSWDWGMKPRPLNGISGFPETDTEYGAGFKEGCISGWVIVNKGAISGFMPRHINPEMITKSADYRAGWWDGHEQCVYISDWDVI